MTNDATNAQQERRIVVLAPTGRDAALTQSILEKAGVTCVCCTTLDEACREMDRGVGALLLSEEALAQRDDGCLSDWLARQPSWSDLPVLLLARSGATSEAVGVAMDVIGNVTVLERPTRVSAFVTAVLVPASGLRASTVGPGSTAPEASLTTP